MSVTVSVNGETVQLDAGSTVADVVTRLTGQEDPRGVAVAIDRSVIPRSEWATTVARDGALVEVVTAAPGG